MVEFNYLSNVEQLTRLRTTWGPDTNLTEHLITVIGRLETQIDKLEYRLSQIEPTDGRSIVYNYPEE